MATLHSLREELAALARVQEKTTPKGNANSSLPSSQAPDEDTALARPATKGKGPAQTRAPPTPAPSSTSSASVNASAAARTCATYTPPSDAHAYIVFEKTLTHLDAERKHCPRCHTDTRAPFDMSAPIQYGDGLKASRRPDGLAQARRTDRAHPGRSSETTLLRFLSQLHHALAQWEHRAIERLLEPAIHADETSLRVNAKNHWIHVYSAGHITLKRLHPKRGRDAIEAIGIITGAFIHDCWASYLSYDHCNHGLCRTLRELTFIIAPTTTPGPSA